MSTPFRRLRLHRLDATNLGALERLHRACAEHDGWPTRVYWDLLTHTGVAPGHYLMLASDQLVGYLGAFQFEADEIELGGLVDPTRRRQGIFGQLLRAASDDAVRLGAHDLTVCAPHSSAIAAAWLTRRNAHHRLLELAMSCCTPPPAGAAAVTLRPASPDLLEQLVELDVASFGSDPARVRERMRALAAMPERQTWLAVSGETTVGKIHVKRAKGKAIVHDLCIAPAYRGAGLGRAMVSETVARELARGAARVSLDVSADNTAALRLYRACGFAVDTAYDYWQLALVPSR